MSTNNTRTISSTAAAPARREPAPSGALRAAAVLLARYQVSSLRRLFDEFERDILLPILLGEIALHNIGSLENGAESIFDSDVESVVKRLRPCNAYSIAAATGLPRETVRRKIARLVELGWIARRDNGHLFLTAQAIRHFGALLGSRDLPELLDTADRIRRRIEG